MLANFHSEAHSNLQMPIVDGLSSTKMIRSFEKVNPSRLSASAGSNGRVPIFAVSASLIEKEKEMYVTVGFDGWVLKPILFARLFELMKGIIDEPLRDRELYKPGRDWEKGGWFHSRPRKASEADTKPSKGFAGDAEVEDEELDRIKPDAHD